jgi:hypothetical protein
MSICLIKEKDQKGKCAVKEYTYSWSEFDAILHTSLHFTLIHC